MLTGFQRGTERLLPGPQGGADRVCEEEQLRPGVNRSRGRSDDTTTSAGGLSGSPESGTPEL